METGASRSSPLVPVRILNEYVYCPRLAYLEWVQGEFVHNADTMEGAVRHGRVDKAKGTLPEKPEEAGLLKVQSVSLSSEKLGITAKIDLVECGEEGVIPVDFKKGKRPHTVARAWAPERVQVCAQGLLLREHGYKCERGFLYFAGSNERAPVDFNDELISQTMEAIKGISGLADGAEIPEPLQDSPKCPRCSLVGICLPDEIGFLRHTGIAEPRPIFPAAESGLPLYVQSPRAYLRKDGNQIIIEEERVKVAEARFGETSQIVLYGSAAVTTPVLHECFRREIPVTYLSYGGWFVGHSVGTGHKNVDTRTSQYAASFKPDFCLKLAKGWVAAKIANCRTQMRRNWKREGEGDSPALQDLLLAFRHDINQAARAKSLEGLLGVEGNAARRYFQNFTGMMTASGEGERLHFGFESRNRRPPKDPVNAMLSLAYAMLAREWTVTLSAVGLDPYRGFFHQPRFGRPALSLDMMEPFRPLIADSVVLMAINNREVKPDDFIFSAGSCSLTPSGRKHFIAAFERRMSQEVTHPIFKYRISYRRLLEVQARLLIRHLTGEVPRFTNFVTR